MALGIVVTGDPSLFVSRFWFRNHTYFWLNSIQLQYLLILQTIAAFLIPPPSIHDYRST